MGTGRKRVEIVPITDLCKRRVTFSKRRKGFFSKLKKLQDQTGCEVFALVYSMSGRPFVYGDRDLMRAFLMSCSSKGRERLSKSSDLLDDVLNYASGLADLEYDGGALKKLEDLMAQLKLLEWIRKKVLQKMSRRQYEEEDEDEDEGEAAEDYLRPPKMMRSLCHVSC